MLMSKPDPKSKAQLRKQNISPDDFLQSFDYSENKRVSLLKLVLIIFCSSKGKLSKLRVQG